MNSHHTNRIVWAFGAECLLLLAVLLFLDQFPAWALKSLIIVAVVLPVICYLPMAMRPAACCAWLDAFKELRRGFLDAGRWLTKCFRRQTVTCLFQNLAALEAYPRAADADAWLALPLFPFKVYVLAAVPFLRLAWALTLPFVSYPNRQGYYEAAELIAKGYLISCAVLLIGSLVQALFSRRGRSSQTLLTLMLGAVMLWTLFPWRFAGR